MPEKKVIENKKKKPVDKRLRMIGEKLHELRVKSGYTSSESFANQFDLSRVHYWRIEKGTNLTIESLVRILDIHKISLKEFFDDFENI